MVHDSSAPVAQLLGAIDTMATRKQTIERAVVFEECFTCGMPIAMSEGHLRQFNNVQRHMARQYPEQVAP